MFRDDPNFLIPKSNNLDDINKLFTKCKVPVFIDCPSNEDKLMCLNTLIKKKCLRVEPGTKVWPENIGRFEGLWILPGEGYSAFKLYSIVEM